MTAAEQAALAEGRTGSPLEVLLIFLKLGVSCFGGPIAHIGYFRDEFVVRRRWLDEQAYADLVALCQFLPGPASSQVGLSLGLMRAGALGGLAAWTGFTLPSAVLLVLFAYGASALEGAVGSGLLHGLNSSPWRSSPKRCGAWPARCSRSRTRLDRHRRSAHHPGKRRLCRPDRRHPRSAASPACGSAAARRRPMSVDCGCRCRARSRFAALAAFFLLLGGLPILRSLWAAQGLALFEAFYRSGALVFGGGHVVLPLLRDAVVGPGWVSDDTFLAGYGAAQAVPGPLFTFAAYLGAVVGPPPNGVAGAALGLVAIFLPGALILVGTLPFWDMFRLRPDAQAVMRGVNASVVGLLGAALYNPVWTSSVRTPGDFGVALLGFVLLTVWRVPPLVVVVISAVGGIVLAQIPH